MTYELSIHIRRTSKARTIDETMWNADQNTECKTTKCKLQQRCQIGDDNNDNNDSGPRRQESCCGFDTEVLGVGACCWRWGPIDLGSGAP